MQQRAIKVNASAETINIGPLEIRFLLTGDDSSGSVSVFEVLVPVGRKLAAPAHKNDTTDVFDCSTVRVLENQAKRDQGGCLGLATAAFRNNARFMILRHNS